MPSPLAWGQSAQLQGSIGQVSLPDRSTVSPKPSFAVGCWKKCLPACHKSQSVGVFCCPIPSPEETAALSHPTKLHQLAAKKTTQETHERCSLVTQEPATPEDSWCPKSVSFISSSAEQAEQCLSGGALRGLAVECFEQQECDRATQKESLVAQTKQLVLSSAAAEKDPLRFQQTAIFVWLLMR